MNAFKRFFSRHSVVPSDSAFENYYGMILRNQQMGGPSASEARRDFMVVRESLNRIAFF